MRTPNRAGNTFSPVSRGSFGNPGPGHLGNLAALFPPVFWYKCKVDDTGLTGRWIERSWKTGCFKSRLFSFFPTKPILLSFDGYMTIFSGNCPELSFRYFAFATSKQTVRGKWKQCLGRNLGQPTQKIFWVCRIIFECYGTFKFVTSHGRKLNFAWMYCVYYYLFYLIFIGSLCVSYCCHNPNQWKNSTSWVHWCSENLRTARRKHTWWWNSYSHRSFGLLCQCVQALRYYFTWKVGIFDMYLIYDVVFVGLFLLGSLLRFLCRDWKTPRFVEVLLCPPGKWNGPSMRSNLWNGGPRKGLQVSQGSKLPFVPCVRGWSSINPIPNSRVIYPL